MLKPLLAAAVLAAAAPAAPALADHARPAASVEVGVYEIDHRRDYGRRRGIDRREAIRIASRYGISRIYDVDYRNGVWQVSGATYRGGRIEVDISARSGRVIDVDYGRRGRGHRRDRDWDHDRRRW